MQLSWRRFLSHVGRKLNSAFELSDHQIHDVLKAAEDSGKTIRTHQLTSAQGLNTMMNLFGSKPDNAAANPNRNTLINDIINGLTS